MGAADDRIRAQKVAILDQMVAKVRRSARRLAATMRGSLEEYAAGLDGLASAFDEAGEPAPSWLDRARRLATERDPNAVYVIASAEPLATEAERREEWRRRLDEAVAAARSAAPLDPNAALAIDEFSAPFLADLTAGAAGLRLSDVAPDVAADYRTLRLSVETIRARRRLAAAADEA